MPPFHNRPNTLADIIDRAVGRILDFFDLDSGTVKRRGRTTSHASWQDQDDAATVTPTAPAISSAGSPGNAAAISATTSARSLASGATPRHTA